MQTIDHDTEKDLTAGTSHDHDCWEEFAERMVEKAAEQGIEIIGRHDDALDGLTLWVHYLDRVIDGTECYCQNRED